MKFLKVAVLFFGLAAAFAVRAQGGTYPVSGRVIDRLSRRPVAYAAVVLAGQEQKGASTDSLGRFRIERVKPGIWRLAVSSVGYKSLTTPEYMVSAATPFIEVELEEDAAQLEAVSPYVEEVLGYQYPGLMNRPGTIAYCGHPDSVAFYTAYRAFMEQQKARGAE